VSDSSSTGRAGYFRNDGTGDGILIDQNGNGRGLFIDSEATTASGVLNVNCETLTTGRAVQIYNNSASFSGELLYINAENASGTGNAIEVKNDGTGDGVFIDSNNAGAIALNIDHEGTTANAATINADALTTGSGLKVASNSASFSSTLGLLNLVVNDPSATGRGVYLQNDGTGTSVYIDHNNATGYGLHINGDQTTSYPQYIQADSLTTGSGLYVKADNATFSGNVGYFYSQNVSSTGTALRVRQDGIGNGVFIDQNGDYCALNVDAESSTVSAIQILADNLTTATGLYLRSNSASHSNYLQYLFTNNASASATTLGVRNQGTGNGIFVDQDGNGIALNIDSECTTGHVIYASGDQATSANVIVGYTNSASFNGNAIYGLVDNPSATGNAGAFYNDGTGNAVFIDQNGSGYPLYIDNAGSLASIYISGNDPSILLHDTAGTTGDWSIRNTDDSLTIRDVSSGIDKLNVSASGVTVTNGQLIEEYATTGTSGAVTINLNGGNVFATPMTGAVTYTFTNPAANGLSSSFTLKVVNNGSAITWPGSVDWPGGTAPTLSASGATDYFVFITHDGGTTWYGFTAGQGMA